VAGHVPNDAVLDGQGCASIELNPGRVGDTATIDVQAAQADGIVRPGVDDNANPTRGGRDCRLKAAGVHNADGLGDGDSGTAVVAGRVEDRDLAA